MCVWISFTYNLTCFYLLGKKKKKTSKACHFTAKANCSEFCGKEDNRAIQGIRRIFDLLQSWHSIKSKIMNSKAEEEWKESFMILRRITTLSFSMLSKHPCLFKVLPNKILTETSEKMPKEGLAPCSMPILLVRSSNHLWLGKRAKSWCF